MPQLLQTYIRSLNKFWTSKYRQSMAIICFSKQHKSGWTWTEQRHWGIWWLWNSLSLHSQYGFALFANNSNTSWDLEIKKPQSWNQKPVPAPSSWPSAPVDSVESMYSCMSCGGGSNIDSSWPQALRRLLSLKCHAEVRNYKSRWHVKTCSNQMSASAQEVFFTWSYPSLSFLACSTAL